MPSDRNVYLAGPIVGVEYGEARWGWRHEFERRLHEETDDGFFQHIHCFSPMRGRVLMAPGAIVEPGSEYEMDDPLENAKSMLIRDTNDIRYCDMVVVNLLGAKRAALGTTAEMGFAFALNKPIVLIMERDPTVFHHHGFITGMASFPVQSIPEAVRVVQTLLTPGV